MPWRFATFFLLCMSTMACYLDKGFVDGRIEKNYICMKTGNISEHYNIKNELKEKFSMLFIARLYWSS